LKEAGDLEKDIQETDDEIVYQVGSEQKTFEEV